MTTLVKLIVCLTTPYACPIPGPPLMASPFATAVEVCLTTTTALDSSWLTLVGYAKAGGTDRVAAWVEATVEVGDIETIESGAGAVEGKLPPAGTLKPVPATNIVEKTRITVVRATPVIDRLSLTFPSPSNYQLAARLNKWPPSFRTRSYTILFYSFCWQSHTDSRYQIPPNKTTQLVFSR